MKRVPSPSPLYHTVGTLSGDQPFAAAVAAWVSVRPAVDAAAVSLRLVSAKTARPTPELEAAAQDVVLSASLASLGVLGSHVWMIADAPADAVPPPEDWSPTDVVVTVDSNAAEGKLYESIAALLAEGGPADHARIRLRRAQLGAGDVHMVAPNRARRVVVERKTVDDLTRSFTDGRYSEQVARLLSMRQCDEPGALSLVLAVVGCLPWTKAQLGPFPRGITGEGANKTLTRLELRDGVYTKRFNTVQELASYVACTSRLLAAPGGLALDAAARVGEIGNYSTLVPQDSRIGNVEANAFACMLSALIGVSGAIASALNAAYPSPTALVRAWDAAAASGATEREMDELLANLVVQRGGGSTARRLGPKLSKRLRDLFMGQRPMAARGGPCSGEG